MAGIILGVTVLLGALILGNVPITALLNPEGMLIVFGGTLTALMISFSSKTILKAYVAFLRSLKQPELNPFGCVQDLVELSRFVRQNGLLALQDMMADIRLPILKNGLALLIDNRPEGVIRQSLTTEMDMAFREDMESARVFELAGGFSPTMGIIGAVIGLIHVVSSFKNPAQMGLGVASAFSATLYGVAMANLFLLPIATKLRQHAKDNWFQKALIVEGVLSLRTGEHPLVLEDKLNGYLLASGYLIPGVPSPEVILAEAANLSITPSMGSKARVSSSKQNRLEEDSDPNSDPLDALFAYNADGPLS